MTEWYIEQVFATRTWKLRKEIFSSEGKLGEVMLDGDFDATHFAAYDGNDVVGVLSLICSADSYAIHFFAVAPHARLRGIGTALLHYARLFVRTFKGRYLLVDAPHEQQYFWEKNGFVAGKQNGDMRSYSLSLANDLIP
ncbi:GNAT family N-acetyltransferase [Sphingobacterium sp. UBA5670]|uniref:GNAT family N-acetyltransferase n=1 Tax=Sphingobacterium sp. UBA5670 TaxID=1947502 RepID=UPI0025D1D625|nr:GNAT family N-acetyltransferase [Sphingobacterium sp. UBA5670]